MKPSNIFQILDLAYKIRQDGRTWNPLFAGDAGLGKSQICQEWVSNKRKANPKFGFIDLRLALLDSQDLVGFPKVVTVDGRDRTKFMLPDFWPTEGEGLLLLEEPNRANSAVMNTLMQLLTDRKVHDYSLPSGWVIAGCINQDDGNYDVNTMDAALSDRFETFAIEYDHKTFTDYIRANDWHKPLINFIESGIWVYKKAGEIGEQGKYISPRTFSKLNVAELAGLSDNRELHFQVSTAELGDAVGREYYKYKFEDAPIVVKDLLEDEKAALKKLKKQCDSDTYRADLVNVTVESLCEAFERKEVSEELVVKVAKIIPSDLALSMITKVLIMINKDVSKDSDLFKLKHFLDKHPELNEYLDRRLNTVKRKAKDDK